MFQAAPPPPNLQLQRKLETNQSLVNNTNGSAIKSEITSLETQLGGLPPTKRLRHESSTNEWEEFSQGSGTIFNSSSPQDGSISVDDDEQFSPRIGKYHK